jgi:hypothetical protein
MNKTHSEYPHKESCLFCFPIKHSTHTAQFINMEKYFMVTKNFRDITMLIEVITGSQNLMMGLYA